MAKADKLSAQCTEISKLRETIDTSIRGYLWSVEDWVRELRGLRPLSGSRTHPEKAQQLRLQPGIVEETVKKSIARFFAIIWEVIEMLKNTEVELIGETEEEHEERWEKYMALYDELSAAWKEVDRIQKKLDKFRKEEIEPHEKGVYRARQNSLQEQDPLA